MADAAASESSVPSTNAGNRKRRNPYTPIACDECKRRKIKCTGERPCKGCRASDTPCIFERTTRYRANTRPAGLNNEEFDIASIPEPTAAAAHAVEALPQPQVAYDSSWPLPGDGWSGPGNTSAYTSGMGYVVSTEAAINDDMGPHLSCDNSLVAADLMRQLVPLYHHGSMGSILSHVPSDRWTRILSAYEEEIGMLYPYLDLDAVRREITESERAFSAGTSDDVAGQRLEHLLILILAVVSSLEDQDIIKVVKPWVEEIYEKYFINAQLNLAASDDVAYLLLCCSFFFLSDRDLMAWRAIGAVMRLLLEMGYHKGEATPMLNRPGGSNGYVIEERLFWCVYAFDRRLSFETRMPFVIQDRDITRDLKFPDKSIEVQFLKHIVVLGRIAGDVRDFFASKANHHTGSAESERDFLDYRTVQWRENVSKSLRFGGIQDKFDPSNEKRSRYRLRAVLYLKSNQLRMFLFRRWAAKPGGGTFDDASANKVAVIARESIRIILNLARSSDIHRHHHRMFNHFIQVALSSLLLTLNTNNQIDAVEFIEDIHDAIELLRRLSFHSPVTLKLMDKLGWVREAVRKLGRTRIERAFGNDGQPPETSAVSSPGRHAVGKNDLMAGVSSIQHESNGTGDTFRHATDRNTNTWAAPTTSDFTQPDHEDLRGANLQQFGHVPQHMESPLPHLDGTMQNMNLMGPGSLVGNMSSNEMLYGQQASPMTTLSSQSAHYTNAQDTIDLQAYLSVLRYPELGELLHEYAFQDNFSF